MGAMGAMSDHGQDPLNGRNTLYSVGNTRDREYDVVHIRNAEMAGTDGWFF